MAMAVITPNPKEGISSSPAYVAKPPPPPPGFHNHKTAAGYGSYNGHATTTTATATASDESDERRALHGMVLALRAAAALLAFVGVALVASCRHGDWMEFARYQEYRYLLGASVVACLYSAAQALRDFRRRTSGGLLDFAGDQLVAYLLITAASAALPITIRMRSAVINVFTDAMVAAISLALAAFAALALSAIISGFRISSAAATPY